MMADGYFTRLEREWQQTRWLGQFLYSQATGKTKDPRELMPLNLDKIEAGIKRKDTAPAVTKEEVEEFTKKWLKNPKGE